MAELVVLGFDSRKQAEEVWDVGRRLRTEELVDFEDTALAWREPDGHIKIQQAFNPTAAGTVGGALWGTLIGAIFLVPVVGLAVGAAGGALAGRLSDVGIDDDMIKRVAGHLQPGKAALFAIVRRSTPDKVVDALRPYNPVVIRTSLTEEREDDLIRALHGVPASA